MMDICGSGKLIKQAIKNRPINIKAIVSSDKFNKSVPKYPEKTKELKRLANSLKETDNPVLMLVRLKK